MFILKIEKLIGIIKWGYIVVAYCCQYEENKYKSVRFLSHKVPHFSVN